MNKIMSTFDAISLINDGDTVGIGGNVLHRAPLSLVREIVRQNKKNLKIVKTAGAMDVDLLCFAECVQSVDAGFISYENEFGLSNHYRKAVQNGMVKGNEHACFTVMSALRAAASGIPFMPVKGIKNSQLMTECDYFALVSDPFSNEEIGVVKAISPDIAILHVHEADEIGNAKILGPKFDDVLLAKASKKVIISAERIVPQNSFKFGSSGANIPHFMVDAVVHIPKGAFPCSCSKLYDIDRKNIEAFKKLNDRLGLSEYIKACALIDKSR